MKLLQHYIKSEETKSTEFLKAFRFRWIGPAT